MRSAIRDSKNYLKLLVVAAVVAGLAVGAVLAGGIGLSMASALNGIYVQAYNQNNLIRFHVIANSDTPQDQALKRRVRDMIVKEMTPSFSKAKNIEEARKVAHSNLAAIEEIARKEVRAWGEDYEVKAVQGQFSFPAKSYGKLTLPAGKYEAVRVIIGKGAGANWWCVLFPPMCFVDVSKSLSAVEYSTPVTGSVYSGTEAGVIPQGMVEAPGLAEAAPAAIESAIVEPTVAEPETETRIEVRFRLWELLKRL